MTKFSIPLFALALVIAPSLSLADTNSSSLSTARTGLPSQQSIELRSRDNVRVSLHLQSNRAKNPFHGGSPVYYGGLAARPALASSGAARSAISRPRSSITFNQSTDPFHGGTSIYYGALAANQGRAQGLAAQAAARPVR